MTARIRTLLLAGLATATAAVLAAPASARADEPLPRLEDAICPGIAGFDTASALNMIDRIRATAQALNRRLADPETCKPNVLVSVVDDGQAVMRTMNRRNPELFSHLRTDERRALLSQGGPVHVLPQIVTRTRDGQPVAPRLNQTDVPQAGGFMAHSKIYTATRQDIIHVLILLDRDAIDGKTVGQIADYVTMRALVPAAAATSVGRGGNSILALFDSGAGSAASGLTRTDRALLATMYDGIPNLPGRTRLAELETRAARAAAE